MLNRAARLLAERSASIAAEMVAEEGKPLERRHAARRAARPRTSSCTPARPIDSPAPRSRATTPRSSTRRSIRSASWRHHPVELPAQPGQPQDRPGARGRQLGGLQAVADDAADGRAARRAFIEAGLPAGVLNVVHGEQRRRAPRRRRAGRGGHVHRLDGGRTKDPRGVGDGPAAPARTRWQEPDRRARRRRPGRRRRRSSPASSFSPQRPGVHRCRTNPRPTSASTTSWSSASSHWPTRHVIGQRHAARRDDGSAHRRSRPSTT